MTLSVSPISHIAPVMPVLAAASLQDEAAAFFSSGLRYLSVCSGIEAATVAWHPLDWTPFAFAEIEPFPSCVLAHHYPHVPNLGDMSKFRDWPDAAIDVLVGGTPCQSFSVAGLRKGLADPRGNLALTFLGLADRYRPEWIIWENVPGVLSLDGGRAFGSIIGGMAELGYGWSYRILDAQHVRVDGFGRAVPQRRRRVFVVGYLGDWRRAAAVLFEPESLCWNPPPRREAGQGIAQTIASRPTGGGGLGTDFDCDGGLIAASVTADARHAQVDQGRGTLISHALNAKGGSGRIDGESETFIAHALRADGFDASKDGTGRGTPLIAYQCQGTNVGEAGTLRKGDGGVTSGVPFIAFDTTQITSKTNRCQPQAGDPCHPLAARAHAPALAQSSAVRRLTPRECERLQGFPDGYTLIPYRGKPASDGPRYKALGNSMAVNVMRWIGTRIAMVSELVKEAA